MAEPNKMEKEENSTPDSKKDIRKPAEGEELSEADQDNLSGGVVRL